MLLALLIFGLIGTAVELALLGHDEGALQFVPFVLIGLGLAVIVWHVIAHNSSSLRVMRFMMGAFIAAGVAGIALHYQGSVEFQKEVDPSMHGFALFIKAMRSKAPPVLAPAIMTQFGLLGFVWTYLEKDRREKT